MREEFNKILEEHWIFGEDAQEILYAVSDMIDSFAKALQGDAQNASSTVAYLKNVAYTVFELGEMLQEK